MCGKVVQAVVVELMKQAHPIDMKVLDFVVFDCTYLDDRRVVWMHADYLKTSPPWAVQFTINFGGGVRVVN